MTTRKLRRVKEKGWLGGVCAGIAYTLGIPTWIIRVVWLAIIVSYGIGLLIYILFWIFMPKWEKTPDDYDEVTSS